MLGIKSRKKGNSLFSTNINMKISPYTLDDTHCRVSNEQTLVFDEGLKTKHTTISAILHCSLHVRLQKRGTTTVESIVRAELFIVFAGHPT